MSVVKIDVTRCSFMEGALDFKENGLESSPGQGTVLYSWERHFPLIGPLFIQFFMWLQGELNARGNPAMD